MIPFQRDKKYGERRFMTEIELGCWRTVATEELMRRAEFTAPPIESGIRLSSFCAFNSRFVYSVVALKGVFGVSTCPPVAVSSRAGSGPLPSENSFSAARVFANISSNA